MPAGHVFYIIMRELLFHPRMHTSSRPTSTPNTGSRLASSSVHGEVPQVDSYLRFPGAPSLHQELKHPKYNFRIPSAREKERRDVYFERR